MDHQDWNNITFSNVKKSPYSLLKLFLTYQIKKKKKKLKKTIVIMHLILKKHI